MSSLADNILHSPLVRHMQQASSAIVAPVDRWLGTGRNWMVAVACIAILQVALIVTHEPWLDEYQAVQLAVQAPDIPALLEWLRYEGHPPLWYLILRGLAHFMDPLATLPATALLCAAAMQGAILFASPFSRAERLMIAASEFVLFEFLTLSRSMTLGTSVFVLVLASWRRRAVWLGIAVLPFCDFLFGVLSTIFVLLKWRERDLWWPGVALWLVSGVTAAWTVIPAPDTLPALVLEGFPRDSLSWLTGISTLALPFQGGISPGWNQPPFPVAGILWIAFLWFAWRQTEGDGFHRLLLFGFIALTFGFSVLVYPLPIRHLMLIALLLIGLAWLRRATGGTSSAAFQTWLLIAAACGFLTAAINFAKPFDTARYAAEEIERLGLAGKHWMVFPDSRAQGVAALTGIDFERTERHCMGSFIRWDHHTELDKPQLFANYLRDEVRRHGRFYLLSDLNMAALPVGTVRPLAEVEGGYDGQAFYLYEVGSEAPERPVELPRCVPRQRPFERF